MSIFPAMLLGKIQLNAFSQSLHFNKGVFDGLEVVDIVAELKDYGLL